MKLPTLSILACLTLASCMTDVDSGQQPIPDGQDDGQNPGNPDPNPGGDDLPPITDVSSCPASATLTAEATADAFVYPQDEGTGNVVEIGVPLAGEDGLVFVIELWEGFGPFEGGLQTGTFEITGQETQLSECSACALVAHEDASGKFLMASGGSINVSAISTAVGSEISVSASNLSFREIAVDEASESDVPGGCTASLASVSMTATLEADQ